jgi:hypothetical protein
VSARCPKCRSLGLDTDCADRLTHGKNAVNDDDPFELEVTLTFAVPVSSSLVLADPHEAWPRTCARRWMTEESQACRTSCIDAVNGDYGDYDLQVRPDVRADGRRARRYSPAGKETLAIPRALREAVDERDRPALPGLREVARRPARPPSHSLWRFSRQGMGGRREHDLTNYDQRLLDVGWQLP